MRSLGLDVGGTNVKLVVLEDGEIAGRREAPTLSEQGPERTLRRIVDLAAAAGDVDSVGVAWPGLFDEDGAAVLLPNLHGDWTGTQLRAPLEDGLGRPVPLINDGHAFALAEARVGAGRGARNVMGIACGTGIGGGLVLGGRLHLGPAARAGEFGHHTVAEDGPVCECGNRGCLELYAGARAIAAAAGGATFDEALDRAREGDARAREAIRRAGELVGVALANVLIFVCPDRVVVGGGVAAAGELLFEPLLASVRERARVAPLDRIAIVPAGLGPYAGAVGAALHGAGADLGWTPGGPLLDTRPMDEADLRALESVGAETGVAAGQVLIERGQHGTGLYVILEGTVRVEAPEGVRELGAGACVGERALLSAEGTRTARVLATSDCRVLAVDRADFDRLCAADPGLAERIAGG